MTVIPWKKIYDEYMSKLSPEEREAAEARIQKFVDELSAAHKLFGDMGTTLYVTKTGRVLTDEEIEAYSDDAERGYDTEP